MQITITATGIDNLQQAVNEYLYAVALRENDTSGRTPFSSIEAAKLQIADAVLSMCKRKKRRANVR